MRMPHLPPTYARLAKRVEEVVALLGANPLPLLAVVLIEPGDETGGDVEAAHIAAHPDDSGRPVEWEIFRIAFVSPAPEPPRDYTADYVVTDGR
jgi:hypothetical protein